MTTFFEREKERLTKTGDAEGLLLLAQAVFSSDFADENDVRTGLQATETGLKLLNQDPSLVDTYRQAGNGNLSDAVINTIESTKGTFHSLVAAKLTTIRSGGHAIDDIDLESGFPVSRVAGPSDRSGLSKTPASGGRLKMVAVFTTIVLALLLVTLGVYTKSSETGGNQMNLRVGGEQVSIDSRDIPVDGKQLALGMPKDLVIKRAKDKLNEKTRGVFVILSNDMEFSERIFVFQQNLLIGIYLNYYNDDLLNSPITYFREAFGDAKVIRSKNEEGYSEFEQEWFDSRANLRIRNIGWGHEDSQDMGDSYWIQPGGVRFDLKAFLEAGDPVDPELSAKTHQAITNEIKRIVEAKEPGLFIELAYSFKDGQLILNGIAGSNSTIPVFMRELEQSSLFNAVTLSQSEFDSEKNFHFKITADCPRRAEPVKAMKIPLPPIPPPVKNDWASALNNIGASSTRPPNAISDGIFYTLDGKLYIDYDKLIRSPEFKQIVKKVNYFAGEAGVTVSKNEIRELFKPLKARLIYRDKMLSVISPSQPKKRSKKVRSIYSILMSERRQQGGERIARTYGHTLVQANSRFNIPPEDLISLLNIESEFGKYRGDYDVFRIFLSETYFIEIAENQVRRSGAYRDSDAMSRRKNLKRVKKIKNRGIKNMGALIVYSKALNIDPRVMKGSFSGAIGICQFLPYNLHYGVDGNGDGIVDLNQMEDAIFSTANYLIENGYHVNREKSFYRYNQNQEYVRAVKDFAVLMHTKL